MTSNCKPVREKGICLINSEEILGTIGDKCTNWREAEMRCRYDTSDEKKKKRRERNKKKESDYSIRHEKGDSHIIASILVAASDKNRNSPLSLLGDTQGGPGSGAGAAALAVPEVP
jgi:hypothetical protein